MNIDLYAKRATIGGALAAVAILSGGESAHAQTEAVPADVYSQLRSEIAQLRAELEALKAESKKNVATPAVGSSAANATPANAAPTGTGTVALSPAKPASKKWYDTINVRGYAQFRYNRLFETNPRLRNEQGDRSWGENQGFFIRRTRLIFSGQPDKRVYFYIQPDFASSASSNSLHFGQLRDAYVDLGLDNDNEFRFRIGQSKIPFGFENLQSSQNRLPLDRADGLNSGLANERDLGVMFYWAPKEIRQRFSMLVNEGYKGSGDYGVLGLGVYNGQTANKPELNNGKHIVARATYPFQVGNQIIETSLQGYSGNFIIPTDQTSPGVTLQNNRSYADRRVATSFILYPRPFGIQAEYNWGKGPEFNPVTDTIEEQKLKGGYVTFSYLTKIKNDTVIPFLRIHRYDGGKKHELDARSYDVKEYEIGAEWQLSKAFELTAQYTISNRRFEDFVNQDNRQRGRLLRLQAQVNF